MDQHKKELALLFMLIAVFSFCSAYSLNVFAANSGPSELESEPSQQSGEPGSSQADSVPDVPVQGEVSSSVPEVSSAPSAPPPSSSPPPASSRPASSKPKRRASSLVSSAVSSETSSEASSEASSSEASSGILLPSVGSIAENDPLSSAPGNGGNSGRSNMIGMLSWACIALGILVVVIVVLSNRRPPRGPGRKRYRRPKRRNKKRLLNDKYYRGLNRY